MIHINVRQVLTSDVRAARPGRRSVKRSLHRGGAVLAAAFAAVGAAAVAPSRAATAINQVCTIASPPQRTTVEVSIPNARDFCELLSQALASEVFRGPTFVVSGALWEYASSTQTCDLRYGRTSYEIVVSNSRAACAWFKRPGTGWHEAPSNRASNTYGPRRHTSGAFQEAPTYIGGAPPSDPA
jgi:hypothetical protein